ncbi:MAG: SDR family NAD(P)-dependent oxidoreductase [Deltaproteobacteria bacterium]
MATFERAVVVGASSGIGEAIALRLGAEGTHVALVARRQAELERVAAAIRAAGGRAEVHVHDVRDFRAAPPLFEQIAGALGGLDLMVYASGVLHPPAEGEYDFEKDRETIEVNLLGAMAWGNLAAARFEAARKGTILGISSIAGERGRRGNPAYGTSKAALTTYLEALRNRVSRYGVRVVTVKPGYIDTAMTRGMKGLFWLVSADEAAAQSLALARRGGGSGFVPRRWALIALALRAIPSFLFRRLNV